MKKRGLKTVECGDLKYHISRGADKLGISEQSGGNGYRLITNAGKDSHQEVPHLHFHLLAGRPLGPMVFPEKPKYT